MKLSKLVFDLDKTHIMILGPRKISILKGFHINAGGQVIKPTEAEKLLGGRIHQSLKWAFHIVEAKDTLVKQLNSRNNTLRTVCRNAKSRTR